jgi:DNA-binding transcriptional regulator YiaG
MKAKVFKKKARRGSRRFARRSGSVVHPAFRRNKSVNVRQLAERFAIPQDTLSRLSGFSLRAVAQWASGKAPSAPAKKVFSEMDRLLDALARLMKPKEVGQWLKHPNPAFDGSSPVQVIERGQTDRIWRLLYYAESGEPG